MSLLEKLPTELLEKVFLYCMNLDLPRSSPVLAGKLSSEVVYLHTIAAAFSPTWDKWHARERFRRVKGSSRVRDKFERAEGCEQGCNSGTSGGDPTLQVGKLMEVLFVKVVTDYHIVGYSALSLGVSFPFARSQRKLGSEKCSGQSLQAPLYILRPSTPSKFLEG